MRIRKYRDGDSAAISRICLETGDSGSDASPLYKNGELLGNYYALPYSRLYPDFTFVLVDGEELVGYALGVPNSAEFGERCETDWFPNIRSSLEMPDAADDSLDAVILRRIFVGHSRIDRFPDFPAHLHIDLLPAAQGAGWGRKLMEALLTHLRDSGVPGVHLGVGLRNHRAVGFYSHLGFEIVEEEPATLWMGMKL